MYFTLSFDILTNTSPEQDDLKSSIKSSLMNMRWVKPISNYYIVECYDERMRLSILRKLIDLSGTSSKKFRFIVSPLINSGNVAGVANKDLWPTLKEITKPAIDDFLEE